MKIKLNRDTHHFQHEWFRNICRDEMKPLAHFLWPDGARMRLHRSQMCNRDVAKASVLCNGCVIK